MNQFGVQIFMSIMLFAATVWAVNKRLDFAWIFAVAFLMVSCQAAGIR